MSVGQMTLSGLCRGWVKGISRSGCELQKGTKTMRKRLAPMTALTWEFCAWTSLNVSLSQPTIRSSRVSKILTLDMGGTTG
jgi:hypothetical protein